MYQLKNDHLQATISPKGAELISLQDSSGYEYIWQADSTWWPQHAPILFPIVGLLKDNSYTWHDQPYHLPIHGFASKLTFTCMNHSNESLTLEAQADAETLEMYPFTWRLNVHYSLKDDTLITTFEVKNTGKMLMPFSIGGHPGFSLKWTPSDQPTDYSIEFPGLTYIETGLLDSNGQLTEETRRIHCPDGHLPYSDDLIRDHALILRNLATKTATLSSRQHPQKVIIQFNDYPHLGVWSLPGAPFLCLEPWFSHSDSCHHDGRLETKAGMIPLIGGEIHRSSYNISIRYMPDRIPLSG